jgi:hypothetical protein
MPRIEEPAEPWRSFFADVDSRLSEDVQLHCCGGFVATQLYGIARTTSDVDFLGVVPNLKADPLPPISIAQSLPGRCHRRHADRELRGTTRAHVPRCMASPEALRD